MAPQAEADFDASGTLRVTVVIPTRNRAGLLDGALASLVDQTLPPDQFEIVVVDDGSTDHTAEVARRYQLSGRRGSVRVFSGPRRGVNGARNIGVNAARADVVCFLDDDEVAPPQHLEATLRLLDDRSEAAGVGGPAIESDSALRTCAACALGTATIPVERDGQTSRLLGGNMAIRRAAFDAVGLFDEDLSGRGDENEWFHRASIHLGDSAFRYHPGLAVGHRRATFTVRQLARIQYEQGKAIPPGARKRGQSWRPSLARVVSYTGHGIARRCWRGPLLVARELGATTVWVRDLIKARTRP